MSGSSVRADAGRVAATFAALEASIDGLVAGRREGARRCVPRGGPSHAEGA